MSSTEEDEGTTDRTLMYYVNDGVYGSFNCILYDHAHCLPTLHKVCLPGVISLAVSCFKKHSNVVVRSDANRSQSQMRKCTPAVFGVQRATASTASWSSATCPSCRWATGWSLRTWAPTRSPPRPPSTASRGQTSTTSCPAAPGMCFSRVALCSAVLCCAVGIFSLTFASG